MSRQSQKQRGRTISELARIGVSYEDAAKLLRYGATLQRLAEATCNGDWPADNGEREAKECVSCRSMWHPSVLKMGRIVREDGETVKLKDTCPDCRTTSAAIITAKALGLTPTFNGDPRGCVFLVSKDGREVCVA